MILSKINANYLQSRGIYFAKIGIYAEQNINQNFYLHPVMANFIKEELQNSSFN